METIRFSYLQLPFLSIEKNADNNLECRGGLPLKRLCEQIINFRWNASVVTTNVEGQENNDGNYTGIWRHLKDNVADISFVPTPIATAIRVADYNHAVHDLQFSIYTSAREPEFHTSDLICSLNVFDVVTDILIIMTFVIMYYALKKSSRLSSIWEFCALVLAQNFKISRKFIYCFCVILVTVITYLIQVDFSADLAIFKKKDCIESLEDFKNFNVTPVFIADLEVHNWIANSDNKGARIVWEKVVKNGIEKSLMSRKSGFQRIIQMSYDIFDGKMALLAPVSVQEWAKDSACLCVPEKVKMKLKTCDAMHVSQPFHKISYAYPMRRNLSKVKAELVKDLAQVISENGLYHYVNREFHKFFVVGVDYECKIMWFSPEARNKKFAAITIMNFAGSIMMLFSISLACILINMLEIFGQGLTTIIRFGR